MANTLSKEAQEQIRSLYLSHGSIKAICRELGMSRNTIRRLIRNEGLIPLAPSVGTTPQPSEASFEAIDIGFIEALFEQSKDYGDPFSFEKHIKKLSVYLAKELDVKSVADQIRLEAAIAQYIVYRRFFIRSFTASDKSYVGPFMKAHEKVAKAANAWADAGNKALDQFNRLIRELEIKNGKRSPHFKQGVFVQQNNSINLNSTG